MSLAEKLAGLEPNPPGTRCRTCLVLDTLPAEDSAALRRILNVPKGAMERVSADQIVRVLRDEGIVISRQSVERHRREGHE